LIGESIKVNQNGYSALSQVRYANFAVWLGDGGSLNELAGGPIPEIGETSAAPSARH